MQRLYFFLLAMILAVGVQAQEDPCDCEIDPTESFVCATDSTGYIMQVPNACFAECFGLTVVEGECDPWGGNPFDDCDCEFDPAEPFVCATDSTGVIVELPNACFAECLGLTVVEGECDPWGGNPLDDCDCEFDPAAPLVCAGDSTGFVMQVPNACFAECLGLTLVEGECDSNPTDNCGCEFDPTEPFVCATDSTTGLVTQVANPCFAECLGLTVIDCGYGGGNPFEGCDCEIDPNEPFICAVDSMGYVGEVPNACFAECLGLTIVEGECDSNPFEGCDCGFDPDEPFVCAVDSMGHVTEVPNACLAECLGLTLVEGDCGYGVGPDPFEDCGCEFDPEEPFICAADSTGYVVELPNACFAACFGMEVVADSICEPSEIDICISNVVWELDATFQAYLLEVSETCGISLGECIESAPIFDNDEDFIDYIFENCYSTDDLTSDGSAALRMYNGYLNSTATPSSVGEFSATSLKLDLLQNPVNQTLRYQVQSENSEQVVLSIFNLNGQRLYDEQIRLDAGTYNGSIEVGQLPSGIYLLNMANRNGTQTIKFVH